MHCVAVLGADIREEPFRHHLSGLTARLLPQFDYRAKQGAGPCTGTVPDMHRLGLLHCCVASIAQFDGIVYTGWFHSSKPCVPADHRVQHTAGYTVAIREDQCHRRRQWPHLPTVSQQDSAAADV
jgi:hypothetical protein